MPVAAVAEPTRTGIGPVRRWAVALALVLAVLAPAALPRPAEAGRMWCRTDPVVLIGGQIADIFVSGPLEAPLLVTGPTEIVVTVPVGVSAWLVLADPGFGRGQIVSFAESADLEVTGDGIEVVVDVLVPATDPAMPVRVEFAPRLLGILWPDSAEGTANAWVSLRTVL